MAYNLHSTKELAQSKVDFWVNIHYFNIISTDDEEIKKEVIVCRMYTSALMSMDEGNYSYALELFNKISTIKSGEFLDCEEKKAFCQKNDK